ncbi:hypothetical protein LXA43DRAFT_900775 [Ganoderma leucocontextum]|nr:hypothetical protein LXA43DRAFT_900775 [Ganoderma leucocontextum]
MHHAYVVFNARGRWTGFCTGDGVAWGGATDTPTTSGADALKTAKTMPAKFVKSNGLDGMDVDYEGLQAVNKGDGKAEKWVTSSTADPAQEAAEGPLAQWLAPNKQFAAGAYVKINKNVGSLTDWCNVQFYNQGICTTCQSLISKPGGVTSSALGCS